MTLSQVLNIVYDGECQFCTRSLRLVRALDSRAVMRFYDANNPETLKRFPALRGADLKDAMYTLADGELPYRGFFAFRRLLWASPRLWPFLLPFYFPGARLAGPPIYAWVARNRSHLGCRSDSCAPTAPQAKGTYDKGQPARL